MLTDGLGNTVGLADGTSVGAEYSYQPFGATTVSGDDLGNPTRFTGREDDGNGLYYARLRYYSTDSSRFVSKDPIGLASGDTNPALAENPIRPGRSWRMGGPGC
ncbi:RHS repeat-associated core domain-containing protein [Dactylosporangium sp. NPDC000521]|uniref:RHS repeat-associated core domain-containing protein n=1 Tax=Dactylosporangium sp. NPDC000521 TaxID=3363975 RepID=UPI0036C75A2D